MRDKLKKSESLEIRLPYPTKLAFMARCRDDGRSASEAMRAFIDSYMAPPEPAPVRQGPSKTWKVFAAGSAAAVIAAAVAAPVLARTTPATAAEFNRLDANHDGKLSLAEFQRLRGR